MVTWSQVLGPPADDPVRGDPARFEEAAWLWKQAAQNSETIEDEFAKVKAGASSIGCEGLSVDAVVGVIDRFNGPIGDLSRVCSTLQTLMTAHQNRLIELRAEADRALARAAAHWNDRARFQSESDTQTLRLQALQRQIEQLQLHPDPAQAPALTQLEQQARTTSQTLSSVNAQLRGAVSGVADARRDWQSIRDQEDEQNAVTQRAIHGVHLGDLKDPGFWDRVRKDIDGVVEFCGDLVNGDVLWKLHDLLDKLSDFLNDLSKILLIVAIVVVIVVLIVAPELIPAVLGAIDLISDALTAVTLAVDVDKTAVDTILFVNHDVDPKTGKTIGARDLLIDAGTVTADILGSAGGGEAEAKPLTQSEFRSVKNYGIIDDRFTTIPAWKKLVTNTGLTEGGAAVMKRVDHFVIEQTVDQGVQVVDHRIDSLLKHSKPITSQTRCVNEPRRLSSPVVPRFAPLIAA